jgi:hypothetical protein
MANITIFAQVAKSSYPGFQGRKRRDKILFRPSWIGCEAADKAPETLEVHHGGYLDFVILTSF